MAFFKHGLGSKKLFWKSHERGSYRGVFACHLLSSRVWSVLGKILYNMSYMGWVIKSYVGRATKELVIAEFFVSFVFESHLVGLRANYAQDVIYGYLTWKIYVNGIF